MNKKCETEYENFIALVEKLYPEDPSDVEEFEDLDGEKTFRTEYAHESITEKGSRFKKNRAEA